MQEKEKVLVKSYNDDIPNLPSFEELFSSVQEESTEDDKQRKVEKCGDVINKILNKYECVFIPQGNFSIDAQGYMLYRYSLQLVPTESNS